MWKNQFKQKKTAHLVEHLLSEASNIHSQLCKNGLIWKNQIDFHRTYP